MGQYFLVVNTAKRQYLDAARFGENNKRSGILLGKHGAAVALLLLDATKRPDSHHLVGSWVGDPVVVTGDYAEPNSAGLQTSSESDPSRNLYGLAREEFEDISREAMLMLIADQEDWAAQFARDIDYSGSLLIELGQLVFNYHCEPLREALEKTLGNDWPKRYREVCDKSGGRYRAKGDKSKYRVEVSKVKERP